MENESRTLTFRFGKFGKFVPLLVAVGFIVIAALNQSNVNGYVVAFFMAIIFGVLFAKDEKAYGEAVVSGLSKPMFSVVAMAIILASISGKLVSSSGLVQTLSYFVIKAGFTGRLFVAFTFAITSLLSFSTGTSVGTYFVVIPILFPVGVMAGASPEFMIGSIVAGAAFGDNLAPISDTTIASAGTQEADLGGVVKSRVKYSIPVALIAFVLYLVFAGFGNGGGEAISLANEIKGVNTVSLVMLLVPLVIIVLCSLKKHLVTALSVGAIVGMIAGVASGLFNFSSLLHFPGGFKVEGLIIDSITGCMGTVAMLVGIFSLLGIIEKSGLISDVGVILEKLSKGEKSSEFTIVTSIGILSMITGVISVAMVSLGDLINSIGNKIGTDRYRRANLMDCSGVVFCFLSPWTVHCVIPAQLTTGFGEAFMVNPASIPLHNFYSLVMAAMLVFAILTGYGRGKGAV